jgi:hypothetical protein
VRSNVAIGIDATGTIANWPRRHVDFVVSAHNVAKGFVSFFFRIASGDPPRAWLGEAAVPAAVGAAWDCRARVSLTSAAVSYANAPASYASPTASLAAAPVRLTIAAASLAGALVCLAIAAASLAGALVCLAIAVASQAGALNWYALAAGKADFEQYVSPAPFLTVEECLVFLHAHVGHDLQHDASSRFLTPRSFALGHGGTRWAGRRRWASASFKAR